eukprot:GEMP01008859.1.p1 GENE.GEMP01008859.1~~GEMP01008859.1.p1  ORF type:complete len:826 (+),score=161.94 GEMP01008859.1:87-2564(+)
MVTMECNLEDVGSDIASKCEALVSSRARWRCRDYGDPLCAISLDTSTWNSFWAERARVWEMHANKQLGEDEEGDSGDGEGATRNTLSAMEDMVKMNDMSTEQARKEHLELQSEEEDLTRTIAELGAQLTEEENEWNLRKVHIINMVEKRTETLQARKKTFAVRDGELVKLKTDRQSDQRPDIQWLHGKPWAVPTTESGSANLQAMTRGHHLWSVMRKHKSNITAQLMQEEQKQESYRSPTRKFGLSLNLPESKKASNTNANLRTTAMEVPPSPRGLGSLLAARASVCAMMTPREAFRLVRSVDESFCNNPQSANETVFADLQRILPNIPVLDQDPNKIAHHVNSSKQNAQTLKRYFAILEEEGVHMPEKVNAVVDKIALRVSPLPLSLIPSIDHYIMALTKQPEVNAFATTFAKESGGTPLLCGGKSFLAVMRDRNNTQPWDFARAGILYPSFALLISALEQLRKRSSIRLRYAKSMFGNPNQHGRHYVQLFITMVDWTECYCPFELQLLHQKLNFGEGDNAHSAPYGRSKNARVTIASRALRNMRRQLPIPLSRTNLDGDRVSNSPQSFNFGRSPAISRPLPVTPTINSAVSRDSQQRLDELNTSWLTIATKKTTTLTSGDELRNTTKSTSLPTLEEPITSVAILLKRSGVSAESPAYNSLNEPKFPSELAIEIPELPERKISINCQKLRPAQSRTATISSCSSSNIRSTAVSKVSFANKMADDTEKSATSNRSKNGATAKGETLTFGYVRAMKEEAAGDEGGKVAAERMSKLTLKHGKEYSDGSAVRLSGNTPESTPYTEFTFGQREDRERGRTRSSSDVSDF